MYGVTDEGDLYYLPHGSSFNGRLLIPASDRVAQYRSPKEKAIYTRAGPLISHTKTLESTSLPDLVIAGPKQARWQFQNGEDLTIDPAKIFERIESGVCDQWKVAAASFARSLKDQFPR